MPKGSKKKKSSGSCWCWYCDRDFEDAKVLLQHQKAKHFRCPHCPRRLNTAGGLAVHIDQVHKLGTDKIENALPGRDSFDVEIYGMEGIPAADLAAWKKRHAEESGGSAVEQNRSKKAKYSTAPLTVDEIRTQLAAHRALMSDKPMVVVGGVGAPGIVPPGSVAAPFVPPFPLPPHIPPPPPGVILPAFPFPLPPGGLALPPPPMPMPMGSSPFPAPGFPAGLPFPPPPGFMPPPPGFIPPPPGFVVPGGLPPPGMFPGPPPMPGMAAPSGPAALRGAPTPQVVETVESSAVTLKPGTLLVYGDNEVSPEEKRAKLAQYKVVDAPAEEKKAAPSAAASEPEPMVVESGTATEGSKKRARATDFLE